MLGGTSIRHSRVGIKLKKDNFFIEHWSRYVQTPESKFDTLDFINEIDVLRYSNINLFFCNKYVLNKPSETKAIDKDLLPEKKIQRILLNVWPQPIDSLSNYNNL